MAPTAMKTTRFSDEQMVKILREADAAPVADVAKRHGISDVALRKRFGQPMQQFSRRYKFCDWPNNDIPSVTAGVYVVWEDQVLIYCGMSGRQFDSGVASRRTRFGLVTRLASHASGRLSGDQFCVYVANRFVVPSLKRAQLQRFASGEISLDVLTRVYIHKRLEYQFATVPTSSGAYALENQCRQGQIFGTKPLLNPA